MVTPSLKGWFSEWEQSIIEARMNGDDAKEIAEAFSIRKTKVRGIVYRARMAGNVFPPARSSLC